MNGYTLKLDLTEYQRTALIDLLDAELTRATREEDPQDPYPVAIAQIAEQVSGYLDAVTEARRLTEQGRQAAAGQEQQR